MLDLGWSGAGALLVPLPAFAPFPHFLCTGARAFPLPKLGSGKFRHEIVRGIFHRENSILLRKNQISDVDTLSYSWYYVKEKFKKLDLLGLWKNPLTTIPCLVGISLPHHHFYFLILHVI